jgi:hypothetical protein
MKFLKKTLAYMLPAMMLLGGTSCSDFLDKAPENKVPEESIDYTNLANMYQPVSGVYAQVRTGGLHWISLAAFIVRDDDVWSGRHDDQADLISIGEKFLYSNGWWGFNETWNQHYAIIRYANAALQDLENFKANITTEEDMKKYETYCGEVRFLRAYAYYRLTQCFGDVVIFSDNNQTDMTRSKRDVVYQYMLQEDLDYAINALPRLRPSEMEHVGAVTAFTAEMLAAKVNLQMGNYSEVERLTDDIISSGKFDLYPDYYNLFKTAGMLCEESLFEVQITNFGVGSGDEIRPGEFYTFQGPVNDGVVSGWGFIGYRDQFVEWAENRGETVRATTTFLKGGETTPSGDFIKGTTNVTATNCWNGKAYLPASETLDGRGYGSGNNVRVFRYADVLLMNAEAKKRQGKDGSYGFNEVRRRAKMPEISNPSIDDILDERRMELAGEWGERYMDLVRTGQASTVLNEGADSDESDNYIIVNGWSEDKTYYPIPLTQIENAPDLNNPPKEQL